MTKSEVVEMINSANQIKVGLWGSEMVYLDITKEAALRKADEIAGFKLLVEFGPVEDGLDDILYIESALRRYQP